MNLIKSLMGRRQFLVAAGVTSTSALVYKRLEGIFEPGASITTAGEKAAANKYPHLLSPITIRNKILKNRILHTPSPPHILQGPENYPADPYRAHYSEMAKNAAIVTIVEHFAEYPKTYTQGWDLDLKNEPGNLHHSDHMWEHIPPVHNYLDQMVEDIHCEGSLVCCGRLGGGVPAEGGPVYRDDWVSQAKKYEDKGYDATEVGEMQWKLGIESVRADIAKLEAVRKASNIIIVAIIFTYPMGRSGEEEYGAKWEDIPKIAKMLEGLVDIIRFKGSDPDPKSFFAEKDKPWSLPLAQAVKESGAKIITAPGQGFHDPALNDEWIASGKTDMIAMARSFFADPEYVKKLNEGRGEDIVPCVRCNHCHGISKTVGPWFDRCTVNPKWGLSETKKRSIRTPGPSKKVAVIGGGPAGMKAAIIAAERGHKVTLYEKNDSLGGLQQHTDFSSYKWPYKDFKDYLIRQTYKAGVKVHLKTTAFPDMIKANGYDTVLVAVGAEPIIPNIPGADSDNVWNIVDAYSNMKSLGKNVSVIGGGLFGTETGISLAVAGHKTTVLTSEKYLIGPEVIGPHNQDVSLNIIENHENFSSVLEVIPTRISEGKVTYRDAAGSNKSIKTDSVVIWAGFKPRIDEAMKFSGSADQVLPIGDCTGMGGTIQKTIRNAFFAASRV